LAASSVGLDLTVDLSIVEMERFAISDQAWRSETLAEEDLERERCGEKEKGKWEEEAISEKLCFYKTNKTYRTWIKRCSNRKMVKFGQSK
jgi:hypothetical protein